MEASSKIQLLRQSFSRDNLQQQYWRDFQAARERRQAESQVDEMIRRCAWHRWACVYVDDIGGGNVVPLRQRR
jgi:hypothetical protein